MPAKERPSCTNQLLKQLERERDGLSLLQIGNTETDVSSSDFMAEGPCEESLQEAKSFRCCCGWDVGLVLNDFPHEVYSIPSLLTLLEKEKLVGLE